jgi:hypothetical protein
LDYYEDEYCFNKYINFIPEIREAIAIKAALREEDSDCSKIRGCNKKPK